MKILKGILIFIVVVALLLVVVTFFLPSKVEMQRSKIIDAPGEVLFEQVNELKNWDSWSPWHQMDPNLDIEYSGENPVGEGAWYSWKGSDAVGSGKLTIVESQPHNFIRTEMFFMDSEDPAFSDFHFEETEGGTNVTWTFDAEMSGMGKWFGLMMEGFIGPTYEQGLEQLDSVATALPATSTANVEEFELEDTWYIGYMIETDMNGISESSNYARGFSAVGGYIGQQGLQSMGMPMSIVHKFEPESVVLEMAIPVADSVAVPDSLTLGKIPAGRALKMNHVGAYENLPDTWEAFETYNFDNQVRTRWYPYEVYVTDPGLEPDTAKWITEIVYPVE